MIHQPVEDNRPDIRTWDGERTADFTDWLGEDTHYFYGDTLIVRSPDGDIWVRPGWFVLKWDDGAELTVATPRIVRRLWRPVTP